MVNLLNLKKTIEPVIVEKIVVKKRSILVETVKMITIVAVSSSIIWAVSNAQVDNKSKVNKVQQPMQNRASQLESFLAKIPTELDKKDEKILTKEINDVISILKSQNVAPTQKAKKTIATSTRLAPKNATSTKLTKEERQQLASTTRASRISEQKTQQETRVNKSKDNNSKFLLVSMKIQAINQLLHPTQNRFAPKFATTSQLVLDISTTPVSQATLHQIVIANSTSTIQAVLKGIQTDRMKTRQEKIKAQKEKLKLEKLATTTPEVATSTDEIATTTVEVATSTESVATTTQEIASSTPEQATTTPEIISTPDEAATTTPEVIPEIIPEVVPEPAPVVEPVVDPAPVVETPATESQP